jgi:hypothetical protein
MAYQYAGRSVHPGGASWFTEPEVADIEPLDESDLAPKRPIWWRRSKVAPLAIGAAVLSIALFFLWRANNFDAERENVVQTRERFAPGACVSVLTQSDGRQKVDEVSCTLPNAGRVQTSVEFPKPCPLQTINVVLEEQQRSLCLVR